MKRSLIIIVFAVICIASIITCAVILKQRDNNFSGDPTNSPTPINTPSDNVQLDTDFTDRDRETEYSENSAAKIVFGTTVSVTGKNVRAENNTAIITGEGTFIVTGASDNGVLMVQAKETDKMQIVFDNLTLTASNGPAVYIKCADKVFITLKGESTLTGGESYVDDETTLDGALFSKEDLTINGEGTLNVIGKNHGVVSKDDLVLVGCTLNVKSENVCLNGKDAVKISGGTYNLNAGSDGIRSDNTEESDRGFIHIEDGVFNIVSGNDGIQAENTLNILNGTFNITTGGGSKNASTTSSGSINDLWQFGPNKNPGNQQTAQTDAESAKALKSSGNINIADGTFKIDSADDCIHSNANVVISGGTFNMASGDDGVHADTKLTILAGNMVLTKSYEGLEGAQVEISGGNLDITADDDGINAAGGTNQTGIQGRPGQNSFNSDISAYITVSGGYILVNASGDGIDSNGTFSLTGGIVLVSGPTNSGNGALDYESNATVSGGILIATGSNGMATGFTQADNQGAMFVNFSTQLGEKTIALTDENNNVICSFTPKKQYQSAVITAPGIEKNKTYNIVIGGTVANADKNGFAKDSTVTGGDIIATVTMSSLIYGSSTGGNMGGGMRPGGR